MTALNSWKEVYLPEGASDAEYERVLESLIDCPDCAQFGGEGWVAEPYQISEDDFVWEQVYCSKCSATGKILPV